MMHKSRTWAIHIVETIDELTKKLTERTWTLCTGFTVAGQQQYLFLNDATCEDGAQEYAVVKRIGDRLIQVESITFSWCDSTQARVYIEQALRGDYDRDGWAVSQSLHIEDGKTHGRCPHCA